MDRSRISVVIPSWNEKDLLGICLDSLLAQTQKANIIVVDNGSSDGSAAFIRENYVGVQLIERDKNYGFTGGVNPGIEAALQKGDEFVALFNNDAVAEKDWLEKLVSTARKHPKVGIVTSKLMLMDKKHIDSTGEFYSVWGVPFPRGRDEVDKGQYDELTEIFAASGGASLYRSKMLGEIGLFDEDFFAYFEDVDMSFRAQLAGWKVLYEPGAVAYHHRGATSGKLGDFTRYHSSKNFLLLYTKNMPTRLYVKYLPLFMLVFSSWFLASLVRGKIIPFMKGVLKVLALLSKTKGKRRTIQRSRKVSVKYIDKMLYHHPPPGWQKMGRK